MDDICDCHFHVFGTTLDYPLTPKAGYTPPVVSLADHEAIFGSKGVTRRVLIQPSCYGTENRCMMEALATLDGRGRAVVAVAPEVTDAELARLDRLGARGIRVNAVGGATLSLAQAQEMAPRLKTLGWHVQTFLPIGRLPEWADALLAMDIPVVLDHFGSPDVALGLEQPTVKSLAKMLATGRCWVKLSAAFRLSKAGPPYNDLVPYAQALMRLRPDRLIWGSDWPYIHFIEKLPPAFDPLELCLTAFPDEAERRALFVENSRVLYGFA
jgi:predicted TIM-barrel fold metal-dependent hydrolase